MDAAPLTCYCEASASFLSVLVFVEYIMILIVMDPRWASSVCMLLGFKAVSDLHCLTFADCVRYVLILPHHPCMFGKPRWYHATYF